MKDFDTVEIRAARTMGEANFFLDRHKDVAARLAIPSRYSERLKATYNKLFMRKGEEAFTS